MKHKFPYIWTLKDARFTKDKGKVFSCFACGGGSTMGYKLAGFDVIGCNEIDPRMNKVYVANHHPLMNYLCDIREMVTKELPDELYHLDVLDGSPPCSSFSMMGNREEDWGKKKHFREGQAEQVLDTLFFDFIGFAKTIATKSGHCRERERTDTRQCVQVCAAHLCRIRQSRVRGIAPTTEQHDNGSAANERAHNLLRYPQRPHSAHTDRWTIWRPLHKSRLQRR